MKNIKSLEEFILESSNKIVDYSNSKNKILVGRKTNLLKDMAEKYQTEVSGDETYYFDKGEHFATLFEDPRFPEIRHDGTLDTYGWRK